MIISSIIAILTILYGAYATYRKGSLPESLSETSYILKPWMFVLFCDIIGILLIPSLLNITEEKYQFIPFIACISFIFAGNSPLYRKKLSKEVHYTFAILAFVLFIVYICMLNIYYIIPYIFILIMVYFTERKSIVFLAEILAIFLLTFILI